ncbi:RdgB/HAM1 family non-canonical purine NTP pyrophosphatase [uncultured Neglectibacter sp.]|uniref:RdgB/HAM1 family non-canonical purine NTP pyrophosphatase n=1 Tax=uncultured Neglectibacter sp. TaxID=1924108 RepID=UPI0034DEAD20
MKFVIATHNRGKVVEFKRMLEPMGIEVVTAELSEPEETGTTFEENAFIKAEAACRETGLPAVADDSGLCVDHLGGEPGIYSARFAEPGKRRLTVLQKLQGVPKEQRGAHFTSAVCCVFPNGDRIEAEGKCYGAIAFESRGENGFGYDSIFEQDGRTFGEMSDEEKDARSHRGFAFQEFEKKLKAYLKSHGENG